jgi:hypothetical protein
MMKTRMVNDRVFLFLTGVLVVLLAAHPLAAQTALIANNVPAVSVGNEAMEGEGSAVGHDFQVLRPITISQLGVFDSGGDGVQGSAVLTVQLYQRSGASSSLLLETVAFDAVNPGTLVGGCRFKPLARPVTLWPGSYTVVAEGFDDQNPAYDAAKRSALLVPRLMLNDGGGLIQFLGCNLYTVGDGLRPSSRPRDMGSPSRFAAGTFMFSAAALPAAPYAADYAALTAGLTDFPVDTVKSNRYAHGKTTLNHYGSIALLTDAGFPVLVEPGGTRLILAAAATYNGDPVGARCVAFAHEQWGHAFGDGRGVLFENAIKWASRKSNPADIVMGVSTNMDVSYFVGRGYQVRKLNRSMKLPDPDPMPGCDVIVVDFHGPYTERFMTRAAEFVAKGGGLVTTFLPWRYIHGGRRPMFDRVNNLLEPFGMMYRSSLTQPGDMDFTHVQAVPYPIFFNAFPAAELLHQDRKGELHLDSLDKAIAVNTIAYAADGRPDLLAELTAVYATGNRNITGDAAPSGAGMGSLMEVAALNGAQAGNRLGNWTVNGGALVAQDRRGSVEYEFVAQAADVYRLQIEGAQNLADSPHNEFALTLSVDGIDLGRHILTADPAANGVVSCWTPYLPAGPHRLRVFWDGAASHTALRLNVVRVQTAAGPDSAGGGIKDWVMAFVNSQSGLDLTNDDLTSYTSPVCLEGRDPYPSLMKITMAGADANTPSLKPQPAPNGRWYANIPLANAGDTTVQVSYQNGAKSETRHLHWALVNVLRGGKFTIRKGDSLALIARPDSGWSSKGRMRFTVGNHQCPVRNASQQMAYQFPDTGVFTVKGTYTSPQGSPQSGSITVNVVEHSFAQDPACWVGKQRAWDLSSVAAEVVLDADSRLFAEQIAALAHNGVRLSLLTDQAGPRRLISRLGDGGPVLSSAKANGFRVFATPDTYNEVIETYPDGSQLVETMVILSPVLPDLKVRIRVIVGGVTFEDGTTHKVLSKKDFDTLGQHKLRFILPQSVQTANCHSLKVIQGGTAVVGEY